MKLNLFTYYLSEHTESAEKTNYILLQTTQQPFPPVLPYNFLISFTKKRWDKSNGQTKGD